MSHLCQGHQGSNAIPWSARNVCLWSKVHISVVELGTGFCARVPCRVNR